MNTQPSDLESGALPLHHQATRGFCFHSIINIINYKPDRFLFIVTISYVNLRFYVPKIKYIHIVNYSGRAMCHIFSDMESIRLYDKNNNRTIKKI